MPPSFYDADVDRWYKKFSKHIDDREKQKKQMSKTMHITCRTVNTNIRAVDDMPKKGKAASKSIEKAAPDGPSEFTRVMGRRRSRQSTRAPVVIDFNYAGDTAQVQHLLEKRPDGQGFASRAQLDYEMNLRNYKNTTEFNAQKPFLFPAVKAFSPAKQWLQRKADHKLINGEFTKKFND